MRAKESISRLVVLLIVVTVCVTNETFLLASQSMKNVGTETPSERGLNNNANATSSTTMTSLNFSTTSKSQTAWCVIDDDNSYSFLHFPHASQILIPCWSWFQRQQEMHFPQEIKCGFYINSTHRKVVQAWTKALVYTVMRCQVVPIHQPPSTNNSIIGRLNIIAENPYQWFEKPQDATVLQRRLQTLSDVEHGTKFTDDKSNLSSSTVVGFINRRNSRNVVNLGTIRDTLLRYYNKNSDSKRNKSTVFSDIVFMEDMSPIQQFMYWHSLDVVITPHGAGVANGLFLKPNTAVVEMYPQYYYPLELFPNLLASAGIRHYGYYNDLSRDEALAIGANQSLRRLGIRSRNQKEMEPPMDDILALVKQALNER